MEVDGNGSGNGRMEMEVEMEVDVAKFVLESIVRGYRVLDDLGSCNR